MTDWTYANRCLACFNNTREEAYSSPLVAKCDKCGKVDAVVMKVRSRNSCVCEGKTCLWWLDAAHQCEKPSTYEMRYVMIRMNHPTLLLDYSGFCAEHAPLFDKQAKEEGLD